MTEIIRAADVPVGEPTQTIELTAALLQALLNMTGGDVECQTEKTRSLVRSLHKAAFLVGNRWRVEMTDEDIETAFYMIEGYCLNRPQHLRTRLMNYMDNQSEKFLAIRKASQASPVDAWPGSPEGET